jgi:hypothetical protein
MHVAKLPKPRGTCSSCLQVAVLSARVSHCESLTMATASLQTLPLVQIEIILAKVPWDKLRDCRR